MDSALHSRRSVLAAGGLLGIGTLAGCTGFTDRSSTSQSTLSVPLDGAERRHRRP